MMFERLQWLAAVCCGLLLLSLSETQAADWRQKSFKVAGDGRLELEYPDSWGKKPEYDTVDTLTGIRFGPYGPREKPIFLVELQAVVALDPITDEALMEMTTLEVANFKQMAFESEIPIMDLHGKDSVAHYFSITDRESKRGEFDYLTMALVRSGQLLIKCYFFSSDGAPDFGADAIRMMQSIKYIPPAPEPEKE